MTEKRSTNAVIREKRYEDGFRVMQGRREYVTYPDDSSVRIWYSDVPWRFDTHDHSAAEICLTLEGVVDYMVQDTVYHVRKGEVLILPPEIPHSLSMGENSSRYLYLFEPDAIFAMRDIKPMMQQFNRPFYLHDGSDAHTRIRETLLKAQAAYDRGEAMWNTACYGYFLRVYAILGQHYLLNPRIWLRETARSVDSEVITAAMGYINTHFREDLSLDDVADFLVRSGYDDCLVDIGGEVRCEGTKPGRKAWRVGIQIPTETRDGLEEADYIFEMTGRAVATSGNYRNYKEIYGQRYCHITDPRSGDSRSSNLLSVTVIADQCAVADAYATAFMVMGLDEAMKFLESHPELAAHFIYYENGGYQYKQSGNFPKQQ